MQKFRPGTLRTFAGSANETLWTVDVRLTCQTRVAIESSKHPGQPVQHVERELPIVVPGSVHAGLERDCPAAIRQRNQLGREKCGLSQDDEAPLGERQGDSLRPSGRRARTAVGGT